MHTKEASERRPLLLANGIAGAIDRRHPRIARQINQIMSRKGSFFDNAAMEGFSGTLKSEFFYLNQFDSIEQLQQGVRHYIHYYNHDRIKLKLEDLSPVKYRTLPLSA
jgi:putative transposase